MSVLIGVAGGTGSGKTSFANRLLERIGEERCVTVAQDAYYKDGSTLDPAARAAINYDHPDAFDTSLLIQDLRDLKERGRTFESVERQYLGSVRPMHLEFVEPSKRYADLIVPEGAENEVALEAVVARVEAMLRTVPVA